ncbi:hypothetical protein B566_EDAN016819 [Ephemera danica]|nr:hypothetical protein B566_EDAN016819 [Ephemera danica]
MWKFAVMAVAALAVASAVEISGDCDLVTSTIATNFSWTASEGAWYETYTYDTLGQRCIRHTMGTAADGNMTVITTFIQDGAYIIDTGIVTWDDPGSGVAKFTVNYGFQGPAPYWVLGTDYTSYAVVWGCVQITPGRTEQLSGILSRDHMMSQEAMDGAQAVLDANPGLDQSYYRPVDHMNCVV